MQPVLVWSCTLTAPPSGKILNTFFSSEHYCIQIECARIFGWQLNCENINKNDIYLNVFFSLVLVVKHNFCCDLMDVCSTETTEKTSLQIKSL